MSSSSSTVAVGPRVYTAPATFASQRVQDLLFDSLLVWSAPSNRSAVRHWRCSFIANNPFNDIDGTGISGVMLDMYLPSSHVYCPLAGTTSRTGQKYINPYGTLEIDLCINNIFTSKGDATIKIPIRLKKEIKFSELRQLIDSKGLDYYKFHEDGCGCLYWQMKLLEHLQSEGCLTKSNYEKAEASVQKHSRDLGTRTIPLPMKQGTFYDPPRHI